ncbi:hypothetical protein [Mycoplasmopsis gallinacea]|uniref:Uncharacterized protein n=1 Tax=Mycoplasmopsis gallinacea TaxID=29556 RepID=A0A6H0V5N0_9BACT|nr:hypothetical protein [Mycoplasmopsis gallinacea]QIW62337.1 hypothetical protein GOQ20_02795 [Mycoplasmopsis gallinacea]
MSKKVNKDVEEMKSFSVKLSNLDLDEKVLVNSWLQELKNSKKSINSALQNILIEYLREKIS